MTRYIEKPQLKPGAIRIDAPTLSPWDAKVEVLQENGEWLSVDGIVSVELKIEGGDGPIVARVAALPFGGLKVLVNTETEFVECKCYKERHG